MAAGRIYFDNAATSALDERAMAAMLPYFGTHSGNPSSMHLDGRAAKEAVEKARAQLAEMLDVQASEIVFTSGGTESNNMALNGVAELFRGKDCHFIVGAFEHPCVLEAAERLGAYGVKITRLNCGTDGMVDPEELAKAIRPETRLISIMSANNVTGVVQDIAALAQVAAEHGILFHTDAVQAAGKIPLPFAKGAIDMASFSAHKLHGPKGVGALYVKSGLQLPALLRGGGQERGLRSGTENVPGIVGFGKAAEICKMEMGSNTAKVVNIREHMISWILENVPGAYLIGDRYRRMRGHICLGVDGKEGAAMKLLLELDERGISVSTGSACSSSHSGSSHVLTAMGFDPVKAHGSLRISLSRQNTMEEAELFLDKFSSAVQSL